MIVKCCYHSYNKKEKDSLGVFLDELQDFTYNHHEALSCKNLH